jgi:hypothetical protein
MICPKGHCGLACYCGCGCGDNLTHDAILSCFSKSLEREGDMNKLKNFDYKLLINFELTIFVKKDFAEFWK